MLAARFAGGVSFPAFAQPKIDGIRCIARRDGLFSRDGLRLHSLAHISGALSQIFADQPDLILDGELWAKGLSLGEISGRARRQAPATELRFHAFDIASADPFADRIAKLADLVAQADDDAIALVETRLIETRADLDRHYAGMLAEGWEGQIIRDPNAAYAFGRCEQMQKRKPEDDAEAEIVGVAISDAGKITLALRRSNDGATFNAPLPAAHADRTRYLRMGKAMIGLEATYRFSGMTPSGLPRDATVKVVHELPRL